MSAQPLGIIAADPHEVFGATADGPSRWVITYSEVGPSPSDQVLAVSTATYPDIASARAACAEVARHLEHRPAGTIIPANGHSITCGVIAAGAFNLEPPTGELKIIAAGSGN